MDELVSILIEHVITKYFPSNSSSFNIGDYDSEECDNLRTFGETIHDGSTAALSACWGAFSITVPMLGLRRLWPPQ